MRYIISILITTLVCGCIVVQPIQSLDSTQISDKAEVAHDGSKKVTQVEGLKLVFGEFQENYYVLNAICPDGQPGIQYSFFMQTLRKSSLGGAGWKEATDEHGNKLALIKETKQTNEDLLFESVAFELTRDWLDLAATNEIKVRVAGAITNQILVFPTNYVSGFLDRVDQEFILRN